MLELRVIHVLVEAAISICAEAAELVQMRAILAVLVHNIEGWMYIRPRFLIFPDLWVHCRQNWRRGVGHWAANVCRKALLLGVFLRFSHVDLLELGVEKRTDVKRL